MSKGRVQCLDFLVENMSLDKDAFLDSLIQAMSDDQFFDLVEYISSVEDWRFKIEKNGDIIDDDTEKIVKY